MRILGQSICEMHLTPHLRMVDDGPKRKATNHHLTMCDNAYVKNIFS